MIARAGRLPAALLVLAAVLAACGTDILARVPLVASAAAQEGGELQVAKVHKEIEKLGVEISKFKEEVEQLRAQNSPYGRITALAGILGGVVGSLVVGVIGLLISHQLDSARVRQMRQDWELQRERNNNELFRDLASPKRARRRAAAAVLIQRLYPLARARREGALQPGSYEMQEYDTILRVLVAVTKEKPQPDEEKPKPGAVGQPEAEPGLGKDIADELVKLLGATIAKDGQPPSTRPSPLAGLDWQKAQLVDVWWERVDARGIDFFRANFEIAGLPGAFLQGATFYGANLRKAVLRGAHLCNANLQGADLTGANLRGADLTGANLLGANLQDAKLEGVVYDEESTKWPPGFPPPAVREPQAA